MLLQTAPTIQEWGVLLPDLVLLVDEALFHLVWVVILHAAAVLLDALVERGCAAVGVWHVIRGDRRPAEVFRAWDQNRSLSCLGSELENHVQARSTGCFVLQVFEDAQISAGWLCVVGPCY